MSISAIAAMLLPFLRMGIILLRAIIQVLRPLALAV